MGFLDKLMFWRKEEDLGSFGMDPGLGERNLGMEDRNVGMTDPNLGLGNRNSGMPNHQMDYGQGGPAMPYAKYPDPVSNPSPMGQSNIGQNTNPAPTLCTRVMCKILLRSG